MSLINLEPEEAELHYQQHQKKEEWRKKLPFKEHVQNYYPQLIKSVLNHITQTKLSIQAVKELKKRLKSSSSKAKIYIILHENENHKLLRSFTLFVGLYLAIRQLQELLGRSIKFRV